MLERIIDCLKELSAKEIRRLFNTNKEYAFIQINVFNAGFTVKLKLTNSYVEGKTYNDCNFIFPTAELQNIWDAYLLRTGQRG